MKRALASILIVLSISSCSAPRYYSSRTTSQARQVQCVSSRQIGVGDRNERNRKIVKIINAVSIAAMVVLVYRYN
jgi:hypothetical protein